MPVARNRFSEPVGHGERGGEGGLVLGIALTVCDGLNGRCDWGQKRRMAGGGEAVALLEMKVSHVHMPNKKPALWRAVINRFGVRQEGS